MTRTNLHLRDLPSRRFAEERLKPEFSKLVAREVMPRLTFSGYKLDEQRRIATHILHNLLLAGPMGKCVADTRRASEPGALLRAKVWDVIVAAGFAHKCLGSESSGAVTRYKATGKLLRLQPEWTLKLMVDLRLERNTEMIEPTSHALVCLHSGKLDPVTGKLLPKDRRNESLPLPAWPYFREVEDLIERINLSNTSHTWQAFNVDADTGRRTVFQPNPCLRQVHVGKMFRAVRLYSWSEWSGQNLSKSVRQSMLIDGEPVAELDYSGMATRMLYHYAGYDPQGDVYKPRTIMPAFFAMKNASESKRKTVRDLVKRVTNICWNVDSRSRAVGATRKLLEKHTEAAFLHKVLVNVERSSPSDLLDRIQDAHPKLAHRFFSECGIQLMTYDGRIMLRILTTFADADKPVLGIHDSVVCRASDAEFAHETMREAYRWLVLHYPVIKRVF